MKGFYIVCKKKIKKKLLHKSRLTYVGEYRAVAFFKKISHFR